MQLFDLARENVDLIEIKLDNLPDGARHFPPGFLEQFDDLLEVRGSRGGLQANTRGHCRAPL